GDPRTVLRRARCDLRRSDRPAYCRTRVRAADRAVPRADPWPPRGGPSRQYLRCRLLGHHRGAGVARHRLEHVPLARRPVPPRIHPRFLFRRRCASGAPRGDGRRRRASCAHHLPGAAALGGRRHRKSAEGPCGLRRGTHQLDGGGRRPGGERLRGPFAVAPTALRGDPAAVLRGDRTRDARDETPPRPHPGAGPRGLDVGRDRARHPLRHLHGGEAGAFRQGRPRAFRRRRHRLHRCRAGHRQGHRGPSRL
ncbi:MAG: hypothetical protein AVDCRST_MAG83-2381, partial [uncultured Arthrobacter sp.]